MRLAGKDAKHAIEVRFSAGRTHARLDRRAPFRARYAARLRAPGQKLRALAVLLDGRRKTLATGYPRC